jgi:hypothetical protein
MAVAWPTLEPPIIIQVLMDHVWGDFSLEFFLPFSYTVDKNAETAVEQNMEMK